MSEADSPKPRQTGQASVSLKKGHTPSKVQGGYVPTGSSVTGKPPTGGSGVTPPKK